MTALTPEQVAAIIELRPRSPASGSWSSRRCHLPTTWRRTNDLDLTVAVDIDRLDELTS